LRPKYRKYPTYLKPEQAAINCDPTVDYSHAKMAQQHAQEAAGDENPGMGTPLAVE
jgi:hypothetical protein